LQATLAGAMPIITGSEHGGRHPREKEERADNWSPQVSDSSASSTEIIKRDSQLLQIAIISPGSVVNWRSLDCTDNVLMDISCATKTMIFVATVD